MDRLETRMLPFEQQTWSPPEDSFLWLFRRVFTAADRVLFSRDARNEDLHSLSTHRESLNDFMQTFSERISEWKNGGIQPTETDLMAITCTVAAALLATSEVRTERAALERADKLLHPPDAAQNITVQFL